MNIFWDTLEIWITILEMSRWVFFDVIQTNMSPAEHIPPGSVTSMVTKSTNISVCQSFNWRLHHCVGQVRVSVPREGLCSSRHPGHPAVQTQRVRQPDQPEHGERLGNPPLRHRYLPQAGRGQVPDPQGPQQGEPSMFLLVLSAAEIHKDLLFLEAAVKCGANGSMLLIYLFNSKWSGCTACLMEPSAPMKRRKKRKMRRMRRKRVRFSSDELSD